MTDLLSSPRPLGEQGPVEHRPDWSWLPDPADIPTATGLARARDEAERLLADHGVTYGADQEDGEHPWHLDPLPVIVDEPEWARLDAGLVQRAELRRGGNVGGVGQPRPVGAMIDDPRLALQAGGREQVGHTEECVLRRRTLRWPDLRVPTRLGP